MFSVRVAAWAALVGCAALWTASATAQVYRIVGPDGKVTFSDRPPPDGKATAANSVQMPATAGSSTASLPLDLRNAARIGDHLLKGFRVALAGCKGVTDADHDRVGRIGAPLEPAAIVHADLLPAHQPCIE